MARFARDDENKLFCPWVSRKGLVAVIALLEVPICCPDLMIGVVWLEVSVLVLEFLPRSDTCRPKIKELVCFLDSLPRPFSIVF